MNLRKAIWLSPLIFFIHDFEEVLMAKSWLDQNRQLLKGTMLDRLADTLAYPPLEFGIVVGLLTVLYGGLAYFAAKQIQAGIRMNLFIATWLILFLNVFTHIGQSVLFNMYTPGVVTALFVVLPYCLYIFKKLAAQRLLTKTTWLVSPLMAVGMTSLIFGLMYVVGLMF